MSIPAVVGQFADAHVSFTLPDGSPGAVDPTTPPTWEASDGTVLQVSNVALDADNKGSSCRITTLAAGTARVICKPDVNLDPALQSIIAIPTDDVIVAERPTPMVAGGTMSITPFQDVPPSP